MEVKPNSTATTVVEQAFHLARAGAHVFPCCWITADGQCSCGKKDCSSPGKHPLTKNGLKDATVDAGQIERWWSTNPSANLAIATGRISGLGVIDIDPRHGGDETFKKINRQWQGGLGRLEPGLRVVTGGGGLHIYFSVPKEREIKSRNGWRPGIDIKCEGGYVIAPPSNHISGDSYRPVDNNRNRIYLPPKWLEAITATNETPPEPRPVATDRHSGLLQRAQQYVAKASAAAEGNRNAAAFNLAGNVAAFVDADGARLSESDIVSVLAGWNLRNSPPLAESELRSCVASALKNGTPRATKEAKSVPANLPERNGEAQDAVGDGDEEKKERKSQSTVLVELSGECDLFHDTDGEAFVRFPVGDGDALHWEVSRVRNKGFRRWLSRRFYMATEKTPSTQSLQNALGVIEAKSIFDGDKRPVFIRVAEHNGSIYIDLGNDRWQVVEIDRHGWRVLNDSPVVFRRGQSMKPLPTPVAGDLGAFRRFANVSDDDWPLLLGFLVAAMKPTGPYAVLGVYGEHGAAKSTLCRYIRRIIDPNVSPLRADYKEPRDLMICANSGWIVALDNLSTIKDWLSDCLCRLSTGGGFSTRTLYENDEETIFDAKRPVILNCIEEVVTRSDLLDRCVLLNLPRIDGDKRIPEAQLDREFDGELPGILGGLLTAVSVAMRNKDQVKLPSLPRMADFAIWVSAAEPALGLEPGEFIEAYTSNSAAGNETAIEASPVGKAVIEFVEFIKEWSGTSTELLEVLEARADDKTTKLKSWPKTARSLGAWIKRLAPNLREAGIEVELGNRHGKKRTRLIELRQQEQSGNLASASSASSASDDSPKNTPIQAEAKADANGFCPSSAGKSLFPEENGKADAKPKADARIPANSNDLETIEI